MWSILLAAFELVLVVLAGLFGISSDQECDAQTERGEPGRIESQAFNL